MKHYHDVHPDDYIALSSSQLRERFLITDLFGAGAVALTSWDVDRTVIGGIMPTAGPLNLEAPYAFGSAGFCDRRELGIINLGGAGAAKVGDTTYQLDRHDGLYLGRGEGDPVFHSADAADPARFYLLSYPAHCTYPTRHIVFADVAEVELGAAETANARSLYKYIAPGLVESCQLVMGYTVIKSGSVWNTLPPHTHPRRSEVYCYDGPAGDGVVMHLMGRPDATRHLVVRSGEAVLSPSWSIHAGAGAAAYGFVWGMGGENQDFADMDPVPLDLLR